MWKIIMLCICSFVIVQFYIPQNICMISTFCGFASLACLMMGHFFPFTTKRKKRIEGISTWYMFKCKRALSWKMVCSWTAGHEIWIYFIENVMDYFASLFSVYPMNLCKCSKYPYLPTLVWSSFSLIKDSIFFLFQAIWYAITIW